MPTKKDLFENKNSRRTLFRLPYRDRPTGTIGVIVHELQSDFITSALQGVESVTMQQGYELMITHSQESMDKEIANAQMLFNQRVQGVIASLSFGTTNTAHFESFAQRKVPVVFFDRVDKAGGNGMVVIDNEGTGYAATSHLIQQGCKRIAIVTSSMERNVYADRFKGFLQALRDQGLPFCNDLLIVNDLSEESGERAARQIVQMRKRPDGLFITNDLVAAICMRSLISAGIRVPDDIAIVGFNNDSICKLTMPTISTINYPGFEMGRVAANLVLDAVQKKGLKRPVVTSVVPAELIVRHSSLKRS